MKSGRFKMLVQRPPGILTHIHWDSRHIQCPGTSTVFWDGRSMGANSLALFRWIGDSHRHRHPGAPSPHWELVAFM